MDQKHPKPAVLGKSPMTMIPRLALNVFLVLALSGASGAAQTANSNNPPGSGPVQKQPKPLSDKDLRDSGLSQTPLVVEALGLAINLPFGATASAQKIDGQLSVSVTDGEGGNTWTMRIQPLTSSLPKPSAAAQVEEHLVHLRLIKQEHSIISNTPVTCGGIEGQQCWLELKSDKGLPVNSGWLILPTGPRTFMVVSTQTLPENFSRLQAVFEACFSTIRLKSLESLEGEKKQRLDASKALLASIMPDQLKSLAGLSQWTRIYIPASANGPAVERGYSLIEVLDASKGAITPEREEKDYTADDRKPGLVVRLKGRVSIPQSTEVYDTIATYWMAWDQSEEAWSIRGTRRQGEAAQTEAESGVRVAEAPGSPPKISVIKASSGTNVREPSEWPVPDVYLSQGLSWLLGRILPRDVTGPREYAWYFYNFANAKPQITQRLDVWDPLGDGSGSFKLISRFTSDTPPIISVYGKDGTLIRRTNPDGSISEPTTIEELQKLWKTKAPAGKPRQ